MPPRSCDQHHHEKQGGFDFISMKFIFMTRANNRNENLLKKLNYNFSKMSTKHFGGFSDFLVNDSKDSFLTQIT